MKKRYAIPAAFFGFILVANVVSYTSDAIYHMTSTPEERQAKKQQIEKEAAERREKEKASS